MSDTGPLRIRIVKDRSDDDNPIGVRQDGARIEMKLVDMQSGHERHAVNLDCLVIDRLARDKMISWHQHDAAMDFIADYDAAGLRPKSGSSYEPFSGGDSGEMSDKAAEAHKRWNGAVRATGPILGDLVCSVVLHDMDVRICELKRLRQGLDRLCAFYGRFM